MFWRCGLQSAADILSGGPTVIVAVLMLHTAGFSLGFLLSKLFGFSTQTSRTISIEVRLPRGGIVG